MDELESSLPPPERRIFCNRTLNLRAISAVGCDMDYTLIHYRPEEWERRAYHHVKARLLERGWPIEHLEFEPELFVRGLILDTELGNVVKANRFGFVKRACHGTRMMDYEEQRRIYARELVDLSEGRWRFMNTFFSLSEACLFAQVVDLLDEGRIPGVMGYSDLCRMILDQLDEAHMEGTLKREIAAEPERFVMLDEELPLSLLDLKHAGKKLLVITNSEWAYTRAMMSYAFDRFLPGSMTWRELFDLVIVEARKPAFFETASPLLEVTGEEGLLRPFSGTPRPGGVYWGGNAAVVERFLECPGEEILYVGDHIYADVHVSKNILRWRTALVARELEEELRALEAFKLRQAELSRRMAEKERLEYRYSQVRLQLQRRESGYGPPVAVPADRLKKTLQQLRREIEAVDAVVAPLAREAAMLENPRWGLLMRAGNDKSHLARQVERYADIYTSRVSNLLMQTPFMYLRSPRGSLPHDGGPEGGA